MELQQTSQQWTIGGSPIKWGAVFAGLVVGMPTQMTLTLLGIAIGAWSIDFHDAEPGSGFPTGTAIWTAVSLVISAFVGGFVTARMAGSYVRSDGMFHGAVVWGLTCIISALLTTTAMAYMVGGIFSVAGSGLQMLGQGAGAAVSSVARNAQLDGGTMDRLRQELTSALQATGKPELQPENLRKDAGQIAEQAQQGQSLQEVSGNALAEIQAKLNAFDREAAINVMTAKLGVPTEQAGRIVDSVLGAAGAAADKTKGTAERIGEKSKDIANQTLEAIGSGAWWLFLFAVITFGMSVIGGALGIVEYPYQTAGTQLYRTDMKRSA